MKVFKIFADQFIYAIAALTEEEARAHFAYEIKDISSSVGDIDKVEEIPQDKWEEKNIEMHEDNDTENEPFYISIREAICGEDPQLLFTNDNSMF